MKPMILEETTLGVEEAKALLENNTGNRRISQTTINQYCKNMLAGRWKATGDTIKVAPSGRLLDGQQRLMAFVKAAEERPNFRMKFAIALDVPEDSFDVMDQGRKRTGAQILDMMGIKNAANVNSASKIYLMYKLYNNQIQWGNDNIPTQAEVTEWVESNMELAKNTTFEGYSKLMQKKMPVRVSTLMALKMIIDVHSDHADKFQDFASGIAFGASLDEGDPRLVLRERSIERIKATQWGYNGNQSELGTLLKAWNAFIEGKKVTSRSISFAKTELPLPKPL